MFYGTEKKADYAVRHQTTSVAADGETSGELDNDFISSESSSPCSLSRLPYATFHPQKALRRTKKGAGTFLNPGACPLTIQTESIDPHACRPRSRQRSFRKRSGSDFAFPVPSITIDLAESLLSDSAQPYNRLQPKRPRRSGLQLRPLLAYYRSR